MDEPQPAICEVDLRGVRALAHPIRVRILSLLSIEGPATGTTLAEQLGVKTGSTSWHLAKLAEGGLIEEVPGRGTRRERWWQPTSPGWSLDAATYLENPSTAEATSALLGSVIAEQFRRAQQFLAEDWSSTWREAWILESGLPMRLTADMLKALKADLAAVVERYAAEPAESSDAEPVIVQIQGFPVHVQADVQADVQAQE